jgi:hypothetical protein
LQAPNNKHGFEVKCAYITIDGLSIEASNKWGVEVKDNEHFTIRNCTVFGGTANNQGGIRIKKSDHSRVYDNRIHTNLTGVRISDDTDFTSLRNNVIIDSDDRTYGVFIDKETDADTLINNTIVGYQIGIYVRGPGNNSAGDGHVIRNNIISDVDTGYDIDKDLGSTFAQLDYNDIDVRDGGSIGSITATTYATMVEWRVATGAEAASLSLDPLFVDTDSDVSLWDLHLQSQAGHWSSSGFVSDGATSPAIDVGDPADGSGVETSPHGSRINQGAYGGTSQASLSGDVAVAQGGLPWGEYLFGGVPLIPTDGDPDAVLGDDFPGLGEDPWGFWWRLVRWDATRDDYVYYKEDEGIAGDPPDFAPGLGYWLIQWWSVEEIEVTQGDTVITAVGDTVTVGGMPVSNAEDYEIPLEVNPAGEGFNQIPNPYLFDIDFADARLREGQGADISFDQAADDGLVDAYAYLWDWEAQAYVPIFSETGGRIPTWRGFWIEQLNTNLNLTLVLPPVEAESGVSRPLAAARVAADDWYVEFAVRGTGNFEAPDGPVNVSLQDISNRAGVKPEGSRRFDKYDARDLQVLSPAFVYVYFPHSDPDDQESAYWPARPARYTFDIRDANWDEQSWLFVVETSLSDGNFEWEWTNPDGLPAGFDLSLEDANVDTVLLADLRQRGLYRFEADANTPRRLRLRVTYDDVLGDVTADRSVDAEDAQAILRHVIGVEPLEPFSFDLGEVTGNGNPPTAESISALDAAWVLRFEHGLAQQLPATDAISVSGERSVYLSEPAQHVDGTFTVPLNIDQADGIVSGDFRLRINSEEIEIISIEPGPQLPQAQIASTSTDDEWHFAFADASGTTGRASLAQLHLRASMAYQDVIDHVELTAVELNEAGVAAKIAAARPESAFLYPAAPNPFNRRVQIRFGLPEETTLRLSIYNVLGQQVRDVSAGASWAAGIHRVTWDGRNDAGQGVASGVYFVQTSTPTWQAVQKLALIR